MMFTLKNLYGRAQAKQHVDLANAIAVVAAVIACFGMMQPAHATLMSGSFTGVVDDTFTQSSWFAPQVHNATIPYGIRVGDPVTSTFTYNSDATNISSPTFFPEWGIYSLDPTKSTMSFNVAGLNWAGQSTTSIVMDSMFRPSYNGPGDTRILLQLQRANNFAFDNGVANSTSLPTSLADLNLSTIAMSTGTFTNDNGPFSPNYGFNFTIDPNSVRLNPVTPPPPPLADFSTFFLMDRITCCGFSAQSIYTTSLASGAITIGVDIGLIGDIPPQGLITTWENGIESTWSDKFAISDGFNRYPLRFDARLFTGATAPFQSWVVNVHSETPNPADLPNWWNSSNWYWTLPGNSGCIGPTLMGQAAAHEFGHYLGLYDEYAGGTNGPFGVRTDGLMGACISKSVQQRYFEQILADINSFTGGSMVLGGLPGFVPSDDTVLPDDSFREVHATVDEPPSLFLLVATGIVALAIRRKQMRTSRM